MYEKPRVNVKGAKNYKIQFETHPAIAVERAAWKKINNN